jgi:flagellin
LQSQVNDTIDAINRIANQTGDAGVVGLDSAAAKTLQSGDASVTDLLDSQTQSVESSQAQLAADNHARLDTLQNLYQDQVAITNDAIGRIEDTEFASETAEFAQSRVLLQSAMAALTYASRSQADQIKHLLDTTA